MLLPRDKNRASAGSTVLLAVMDLQLLGAGSLRDLPPGAMAALLTMIGRWTECRCPLAAEWAVEMCGTRTAE